MIDQSLISVISACTALIASVAGPFVTLRVGRQQFRANVLSVNRQRWIDTMRDSLASLIAQLQSAAMFRDGNILPSRSAIATDIQLLARVEELARTIAKVNLLMNPGESDHRRLRELMDRGLDCLRSETVHTPLIDDMDQLTDDIIKLAQVILKNEWVRVKRGT